MEEQKKNRGGKRKGAGRPQGCRQKAVTFRLSERAIEKLAKIPNKSQYVDNLILDDDE